MYLTVGSRACVYAMCVYCVCGVWGRPRGAEAVSCAQEKRPVSVSDFLPLQALLYFPEGCHFGGGWKQKLDIKGHFSCAALSGFVNAVTGRPLTFVYLRVQVCPSLLLTLWVMAMLAPGLARVCAFAIPAFKAALI